MPNAATGEDQDDADHQEGEDEGHRLSIHTTAIAINAPRIRMRPRAMEAVDA